MTVTVPVSDMDVQFDISLQQLFSVHTERGMNEIGAGLAIPESELDDLDEATGNSTESGPERAGVPHGLPFKFSPFFGEMAGRFAQNRCHSGGRALVNGLVRRTERFLVRFHHTTIKSRVI